MIRQRQLWLIAAAMITLIAALGSVLGSREVAVNDAQSSRHLFDASSANIVSTLNLDIEHEQDLVVTMGAYFVTFPDANQHQFRQWMTSLKALRRYPELRGVAEVIMVPHAQLASFEAGARANPAGALGPGHAFVVSPPGSRPYYCFAKVELTRAGAAQEPAGLDYCDSPLGPLLMKARDNARGAFLPFGSGATQEFVVGSPVYATGTPPATRAERRADFLGWTGTELVPDVLLTSALRGHSHMAVTFQFRSGAMFARFHAGKSPVGAQSTTVNLHNGWSVQTFAAVNSGSIGANANSLALLLVGLALSLLLGAMIYLLGTGRSRALVLVQERTAKLEHLALHDLLTGLPNRALILDRIGQVLARVRRDHTKAALLFVDLDNFRDINDTLGHEVGDELLRQVGARLSSMLREGDTVGRLGSDEFVVLAEGASLHPDSDALAQRVLDALTTPFDLEQCEVPLVISASIGIAEGLRSQPEELLRDASIAMDRAKSRGKRRAVVFAPFMQEDVVDKRTLSVDLRRALDEHEFFLMYQPIVDLKSGRITGVEALLRWRHPERGVIQPDEFIPALESSGLIVPVGLWVLQEACRQGATWIRDGLHLSLSVNISAKQLERDRIVDDVNTVLASSGYPAQLLSLELTETTLMNDADETIERLHLLKTLGIRLAIDDFGTGYSSMAYLRQFPIDVIKIDRSFISNVVDTVEAASLVHTLVQLGKDLGLRIIAEGVETDEQRQKLIAEETDAAQGYLFARPLLPQDIPARFHLGTTAALQTAT